MSLTRVPKSGVEYELRSSKTQIISYVSMPQCYQNYRSFLNAWSRIKTCEENHRDSPGEMFWLHGVLRDSLWVLIPIEVIWLNIPGWADDIILTLYMVFLALMLNSDADGSETVVKYIHDNSQRKPSFPVSDYFQVVVWFCVLSLYIFLGLGFFPQGMLLRSGVPSQLWYHDNVPVYCFGKCFMQDLFSSYSSNSQCLALTLPLGFASPS
ncbi:uncharacterized protein ARMOST_11095 [Armillaria ostoyae]|uniref:Uncharacterized protein n=1 Tax=Armillaria ostoyae TaxID=47428 RepID=A0A284RG70_ARMOS|nr:uncharacterized protein ARMOST_11095 [Armillaria ostoyae]